MEHQLNLFSTTPEESGYRLQYMELLNWGTFDKEIYRINPQGNNSLLTGANASGKSTLIDALLTLLVPSRNDRFYNQSSGAEKKGARSLESYVLGYYGTQQEEGASSTTTMKLRGKSTRSVLLASFSNADAKTITLFQVHYFTNQGLKTVYGIAQRALSIKEDLVEFDANGEWRKRLNRKYQTDNGSTFVSMYDRVGDYATQICELFHMRSKNALTLFGQIVGVKVLNDLDFFIRHNMLDGQPAEEKYKELHENFQNLMGAKNSIDKIQDQIKMLVPIDEAAKAMQTVRDEIHNLEQNRDVAAVWFADRIVRLADEQKHSNDIELRKKKERLASLETQARELQDRINRQHVAIAQDEVSQQIAELVKQINNLTQQRDKRKDKAEAYEALARQLDYPSEPSQEDFFNNRDRAKQESYNLQKKLEQKAEEHRKEKNAEESIGESIEDKVQRINELKKNNNNIAGRVSEIRNEILQEVGATSAEIPFIGELIRIKDTESEWQAAIERILHNFALRLIVPDKYYKAVNRYVNSHNLNGRIVYHRYKGFTSLKTMEQWTVADNELLRKIEFKPDNRYVDWIENEIYQRYNYACVDTLDEFNRCTEKAVTQEGLIKSVGNKHEKDDRKEARSRDNYVLGWDNEKKITALTKEVHLLQKEQMAKLKLIQSIEQQQRATQQQIDQLNELLNRFEEYDLIDWASCAATIQQLTVQKKELEAANNKAKVLREELDRMLEEQERLVKERDQVNVGIHDLDKEQEALTRLYESNSKAIEGADRTKSEEFEHRNPELLKVSLKQLETKRADYQADLRSQLEEKEKRIHSLKLRANNLVNAFRRPSKELTDKYHDWTSDVSNLPEHIDFIEEYQVYYNRLVEEDLVSYQTAFNNYLQENVYTNINLYRLFFDKWESDISKAIAQLNESLKGIVFNKDQGTYIQLAATKKPGAEIKDFIRMLHDAIPNLHEVNASIDGRQQHFTTYIEPFMEKLEEEKWRDKVTDVRTWFTYRAEEFYKDTDQRCKAYESMGQLSGGEKAQLTYTILGSAIAYQFGFTKCGLESSFRFIAIDEAFKAQDEDKARYLLDLCRQLHLQLLVVTPSDNIHIVEDSISYVHYVERKGHASILYNLPIVAYQDLCKQVESHDTTL